MESVNKIGRMPPEDRPLQNKPENTKLEPFTRSAENVTKPEPGIVADTDEEKVIELERYLIDTIDSSVISREVISALSGTQTYFQMFNPDARDLADQLPQIDSRIKILENILENINSADSKIKNKLQGIISQIVFFKKEAERNRIGRKEWFGGAMKNRDVLSIFLREINQDMRDLEILIKSKTQQ